MRCERMAIPTKHGTATDLYTGLTGTSLLVAAADRGYITGGALGTRVLEELHVEGEVKP